LWIIINVANNQFKILNDTEKMKAKTFINLHLCY